MKDERESSFQGRLKAGGTLPDEEKGVLPFNVARPTTERSRGGEDDKRKRKTGGGGKRYFLVTDGFPCVSPLSFI